tara:strand:- start:58 stop:708 length:651 start_codon:yes stop_codon:yes gene_type:complete
MAKRPTIPTYTQDLLKKFGIDPNKEDVLWDCHGTWVIYSRWIEEIGLAAGVVLDTPEIIHSDPVSKHVVILVRGKVSAKKQAWSFGEAAPYNNKNSYPYAMAEKRAKDRVILKLVGLHGHVYTREDIPDIQDGKPIWELKTEKPQVTKEKPQVTRGAPSGDAILQGLKADLLDSDTTDELAAVANAIGEDKRLSENHRSELRELWAEQKTRIALNE